jgi:adenylosuccinate lyase
MPFMATERWLMLGVEAGGDRQRLHEVIRRHALAVADRVATGEQNDLLERLAADPSFGAIDPSTLQAELVPERYVGRAPEQVGEFLEEYLDPLVAAARDEATFPVAGELRV